MAVHTPMLIQHPAGSVYLCGICETPWPCRVERKDKLFVIQGSGSVQSLRALKRRSKLRVLSGDGRSRAATSHQGNHSANDDQG